MVPYFFLLFSFNMIENKQANKETVEEFQFVLLLLLYVSHCLTLSILLLFLPLSLLLLPFVGSFLSPFFSCSLSRVFIFSWHNILSITHMHIYIYLCNLPLSIYVSIYRLSKIFKEKLQNLRLSIFLFLLFFLSSFCFSCCCWSCWLLFGSVFLLFYHCVWNFEFWVSPFLSPFPSTSIRLFLSILYFLSRSPFPFPFPFQSLSLSFIFFILLLVLLHHFLLLSSPFLSFFFFISFFLVHRLIKGTWKHDFTFLSNSQNDSRTMRIDSLLC